MNAASSHQITTTNESLSKAQEDSRSLDSPMLQDNRVLARALQQRVEEAIKLRRQSAASAISVSNSNQPAGAASVSSPSVILAAGEPTQ